MLDPNDYRPVRGMKKIAPLLNMSEREAYHAAESGSVPGLKKIAGRYLFVPALFVAGMAQQSGEAA